MLPEDIYDVLAMLVGHAARSGLPEHLLNAARDVIERADPKIAEKRKAAETAQTAADEQYQRFLAFQAMEQRQAAGNPAPAPAPAVPASPLTPPAVS